MSKTYCIIDNFNIFNLITRKKKTYSTVILMSNRKLNLLKITEKNGKLKKGEYKFSRNGQIYENLWKDKRNVITITTGY